jgi:hypothetical protein
MRIKLLLLACLAACLGVTGPTTAPAGPGYDSLIAQLGDADFSVRESASAKLAAAGPDAREALQEASSSGDPETRWRAAALLERLDIPPVPGMAPQGPDYDPGIRLSVRNEGNTRIVDSQHGGRKVHVEQGPDGITMTVHGYINGKPADAQYTAASPQDLKAKSHDAFDLYNDWGRGVFNGVVLNPRVNVNNLQRVSIPQVLVFNPPTDDISKVAVDMLKQMEKAAVNDRTRDRLLQQVQQVKLASETASLISGENKDAQSKAEQEYLKACDELRRLLAAAGLQDPGAELPPPASSRLGVSLGTEMPGQGGLPVMMVQDGSRGSKLGLLPGDLIRAINGKPVTDVRQLRTEVTAQAHLVLTVVRSGKEITLREPEPTASAQ